MSAVVNISVENAVLFWLSVFFVYDDVPSGLEAAVILVNQLMISPLVGLMCGIWNEDNLVVDFGWGFLVDMGYAVTVHCALFYVAHRLLHFSVFNRRIHVVHHSVPRLAPWTSQYAHPIEHFLVLFTILFPCSGMELYKVRIFTYLATVAGLMAHVPGSFHSVHHLKSRVNFGSLYVFDYIMGTAATLEKIH